MAKKPKKKRSAVPIYAFAASCVVMALALPDMTKITSILLTLGVSFCVAFTVSKFLESRKPATAEEAEAQPVERKSYGAETDAILDQGNKALSEMGRIYMSVRDEEIRKRINELMRLTDKITQDAIEDPSDIPQIKKFLNYYLPTTLKLLNTYDRMSSTEVRGENIGGSMDRIEEMLDVAIDAYRKKLDSLFANQALDIDTDIQVMNTLLAREGLTGSKDFDITQTSN